MDSNKKQQKKGHQAKKMLINFYLILQGISGLVTIILLCALNMLPLKYILAVCVLVGLLQVLTVWLINGKHKKKSKKDSKKRKWIGMVLTAFLILIYLYISYLIYHTDSAISDISSDVEVEDIVAVYAMSENEAETIGDAIDYNFGYTLSYDGENATAAIDRINSELDTEITVTEYDDVLEMVSALYNGEIDAMILNEAYAGILEEQEDYTAFATDTKILYEYSIYSSIEQEEVEEKALTETPFILYISGSDTRSKKLATSRSDVNILAVINPVEKQVLLVNTPRDYYVSLSIAGGEKDKLTHAGLYGVDVSMDTLSLLYDDIPINYYAQINFTGFEELIDAIGGVTIESESSFTTLNGGYQIVKGENYLNGAEALGYVREREALSGGDNQRGKNQMKVISAVIDKLSSPALLANYANIMDSLSGTISTNLTSDQIQELVKMQLDDGGTWTVLSTAVTGEGSSSTTYSMPNQKSYVMIPYDTDVEFATELINRALDGEILTEEDLVQE